MDLGARLLDFGEREPCRGAPAPSASRVGVIPKLVFSNNGTPSSRSSSRAERWMLGCDTWRARAAMLKLPCSTTAPSASSCLERTSLSTSSRSAPAPRVVRAKRLAQLAHRAFDARETDLAGACQGDARATPQQQRRTEVALQAGDGLGHRGL